MSHARQLFGGAITVSLPSQMVDASEFRDIPDNQEVFVDNDSDVSWIIEILQRVDTPSFSDAITTHFDALASDNEADGKRVDEVVPPSTPVLPCPPNQPTPTLLTGTQSIRKFNKPDPDEVRIAMALYRIEGKNSDVVMTMNFPVKEVSGSVPETDRGWEFWRIVFMTAVQSFTIDDFNLFAS